MKFTLRRLAARKRWLLNYRTNGKQHRLVFKTKELAEAEQERIEKQIADGGSAWLALSAAERIELMAVVREMKQAGKSLRGVWEEYKRRTMGTKVVDKKLGDAFTQFKAEREQLMLSKRTMQKIKSSVGRFITPRAAMFVSQITRAEVADYLAPFKGETFNTYRTTLNTFLKWCVKLKFTEENPLASIEAIDLRRLDRDKSPAVLHYAQCVALLKATMEHDPGLVRYVALCLLAGLRPEREAKELHPSDITDRIQVRGRTAKDRQQRYVEIVPALAQWIALPLPAPFQGPAIGDWPIVNLRRRFNTIRLQAGLLTKTNGKLCGWRQDCMRHTFASAYFAANGAERTIEALGHGDYESLFGHYRRLMTKEEGQKILSITPAITAAFKAQSP